jgi:hypothetical protein
MPPARANGRGRLLAGSLTHRASSAASGCRPQGSAVLAVAVALLTLPAARPVRRLVVLLVVIARQRQPRLHPRRRLRLVPAVGLADVLGALSVGAPTVAGVVLGLAVTLLTRPVALPVGRRVAGLLAAGRSGSVARARSASATRRSPTAPAWARSACWWACRSRSASHSANPEGGRPGCWAAPVAQRAAAALAPGPGWPAGGTAA